jgi:hypothetical protein
VCAGEGWKRNVAIAERLIAVERAKANGRWDAAHAGPANIDVPADLAAALDASPAAREMFQTLNSRNRDAVFYRIETATLPRPEADASSSSSPCSPGQKPSIPNVARDQAHRTRSWLDETGATSRSLVRIAAALRVVRARAELRARNARVLISACRPLTLASTMLDFYLGLGRVRPWSISCA